MLWVVIYILLLLSLIICYINRKQFIEEGFLLCSYNSDYCKKNNIIVDKKQQTLNKDGIIASYNLNDPTTNYTCTEKDITSNLLSKNNISVPKFYVWKKDKNMTHNLRNIYNNLTFPLVVKPTIGTQGYGIKTNINNEDELKQQILFLLDNQKKERNNILIEEQISGNDYRITVLKGDILGIAKRESPYVIGDGKQNLQELINEHKYSKFKPHNIDQNIIQNQKVSLQTIIPKNKKTILSTVNNFHNGASITNIPISKVHPDNLYMFKRVNQVLNKNISGIDYISDNLAIPYYHQGAIIEVNEKPDTILHTYTFNEKQKQMYLDTFIHKIFN